MWFSWPRQIKIRYWKFQHHCASGSEDILTIIEGRVFLPRVSTNRVNYVRVQLIPLKHIFQVQSDGKINKKLLNFVKSCFGLFDSFFETFFIFVIFKVSVCCILLEIYALLVNWKLVNKKTACKEFVKIHVILKYWELQE